MEKAKIKLLTTAGQPSIDVMFNPDSYTITRNMTYAEIGVPGLSMPLLQFLRGEAQTLQLELFLDSSDRKTQGAGLAAVAGAAGAALGGAGAAVVGAAAGALSGAGGADQNAGAGIDPVPANRWAALGSSPNCEQRLMALRLLGEIDSELHAPPVIEFSWGGSARFRGVVTTVTEKFQMFDADGHVIRARVTLTLKSYVSAEEQFRRINPQSPDRTKTHVVRAGERIDMIAAREYGDPERWTVIAEHNGLARPRLLTPGSLLIIPPLA
jgi:nucleoid-associated protein YgaU